MKRNAVFRRHVDEHAAKIIVRDGGQKIGRDAELGAGKGRRDRVAAERDGIIPRDGLVVPGRNLIRQEGHVDIGLANEKSIHCETFIP